MKIAFLCNPALHRLKKFPSLVALIQKFVPTQLEIFLVDRSLSHSLETHVDKILDEGYEKIAVVGGDGTLNRAVNALLARRAVDKVTLGIIPFGTCNDFARSLGFSPNQLSKPLQFLTQNSFRSMDIARVNDCFFLNNAGFGKRNPTENRSNNFRVIREMVPVNLTARWAEGSLEGNFFMMLCANAPFFSGGLRFNLKSDPSDGQLDFFFVRKMSKLNLAVKLLLGKAGIPLQGTPNSKNVFQVSAQKLTIETDMPVSMVVDGDPRPSLKDVRKATFEISENCRFLIPS